ncbi:hypothetical protein ACS0TY_012876 [Phlomoides rotata]
MQQHNEAELSALGMAISTVVSIAEILKNGGFSVEKKITTSTVEIKDDSTGRFVPKAKVSSILFTDFTHSFQVSNSVQHSTPY